MLFSAPYVRLPIGAAMVMFFEDDFCVFDFMALPPVLRQDPTGIGEGVIRTAGFPRHLS